MEITLLRQIVAQHADEPGLVGSLACYLRQNDPVVQQHEDGREFDVLWRERPGHSRCTIFVSKSSENCIAQIDIHEEKTFRVEAHEPLSITVDPGQNLLVLVRFRTK